MILIVKSDSMTISLNYKNIIQTSSIDWFYKMSMQCLFKEVLTTMLHFFLCNNVCNASKTKEKLKISRGLLA